MYPLNRSETPLNLTCAYDTTRPCHVMAFLVPSCTLNNLIVLIHNKPIFAPLTSSAKKLYGQLMRNTVAMQID